ncbi:hypothetical protein [Chenggangzhangella methanolivorans]|uniref:hypothetical protein n=1 Tax=Chenggangzhangella methanolivorans TaxID=1437009 RepID=UPI003D17B42E
MGIGMAIDVGVIVDNVWRLLAGVVLYLTIKVAVRRRSRAPSGRRAATRSGSARFWAPRASSPSCCSRSPRPTD